MILLLLAVIGAEPQKITPEHALIIAEKVHTHIITDIKDYTGMLIKREYIDGRSTRQEFIQFKFRQEPLGIYLKYLKPTHMIGREALYNGGDDFIVRRGGKFNPNLVLVLRIDSPLALATNKYTIKEMGLKILAERLISKLKGEMSLPDTEVLVYSNAKFDGRPITLYRLVHHTKVEGTTCATAEIAIDKELNIPVYYKAVGWQNIVLEEYAFRNVKLNVGLVDSDFDENNKNYRFERLK